MRLSSDIDTFYFAPLTLPTRCPYARARAFTQAYTDMRARQARGS